MADIGFDVIGFDQRGAGKTSPGKDFAITNDKYVFEDLDRIVEFAAKDYDGKLFMCGHSMVCCVALEYSGFWATSNFNFLYRVVESA